MAPALIKLTGIVSIEKWKVLQFIGAPNENIVQNHLLIALLNVF